jgi:hypothetical protein
VRRRFHGSREPESNVFRIWECKAGASCAGRLHFYAFDDAEGKALTEIIDAHFAARRNGEQSAPEPDRPVRSE